MIAETRRERRSMRAAGMKAAAGAVLALALAFAAPPPAAGQMTPEEAASRARWEEFLATAEVVASERMSGKEAVTQPWVLTLRKGDEVRRALWKDIEGRPAGFVENWRYEIAASRLDEFLGLHMVPPTIERRFRGIRGSCQLWIDDAISLKTKEARKIRTPAARIPGWNRATYLQRAFDNLVANEDRHMNQVLITADWRLILIDHSRSFRATKKFVRELIYTERHREGPKLMRELPRAFVEKLRALDPVSVRAAVGEYLADDEIAAVLARRDLILREVARLTEKYGESSVLY